MGAPTKRAFRSKRRKGCRSWRNASRKRAVCFRANRITRIFVIITDQLKIEPMARVRRTILPATVACSKAKTKPPAANRLETNISASPGQTINADSQKTKARLVANDEGRMVRAELALDEEEMTRSEYTRSFVQKNSSFGHFPPCFAIRHSSRKCRPQFRDDDKCNSDRKQERGEELTAGEGADQWRVWFAKIFANDTEDRVEDEK